MSIYVLRSDNLVKIGFSDNLRTRVSAIVSAVPVPVEFVGHMPGCREVEAHLHERFRASQFSGEWFVETEGMREVFDLLLIPSLPDLPEREQRDRSAQRDRQAVLAVDVRNEVQNRWPHKNASQRLSALSAELGWKLSRTKDFYYSDERMSLRGLEQKQVEEWLYS